MTLSIQPCIRDRFVLRYVSVEIHKSARKHRVSDEAIAHAYDNALARLDYDPDEDPPRYAVVGPDVAGNMLELVVIVGDGDRHIVIHAMNARPNFVAFLGGLGDDL